MKNEHKIKDKYTEDCSCKKCDVYAEITEYCCGCVEVEIFNDSTLCYECIDFSVRKQTSSKCREKKVKSEKLKVKNYK